MSLIITYDKMKQVLTESEGYDYVLQLAKTFKYPLTSFLSGSIGYTLLKTMGAVVAIMSDSVAALSKQIYVKESSGEYLTLLADNHFDLTRDIATQTIIKPRIVTVGAIPQSYDAESVKIKIGEVEFYNTELFSVVANGTVDVSFTSTDFGEDTRVATNIIPIFSQNIIGNANFQLISNQDGYFTVVSNGQNEETDADLKERCITRFPTLASQGPELAYRNWILSALDQDGIPVDITRIKIDRSAAQSIGSLIIYLASDTGAASTDDIAAANLIVQKYRSINATVYLDPAHETAFVYNLNVKVNGDAAQDDALLRAAILECIKSYTGSLEIGGTVEVAGEPGYVYWSEIVDKIMDITGMVNVTFNSVTVDGVSSTVMDQELDLYEVVTISDVEQTLAISITRV